MLTKMGQSTEPYDTVRKWAIELPDGQVAYRCPHHGHVWGDAIQTPQHSCEYCWCIFWIKVVACTDPKDRPRLFEELEKVLLEANRLAENGQWDVEWTAPQTSELILTDAD